MKMKFLSLTCMVLTTMLFNISSAFTQSVPQGINYQAIARDANGNELVSTSLSVKLAVLSKSGSTYTTQWEETHSVTTNQFGLFSLVIGQGTTTGGGMQSAFSSVPWSSYEMYLNVSVNDGNGYVDLGKTQLVSVPYAFVSGSSISSSTGATGATGPSGANGSTGATGAAGATGPTGADGSANAWGLTGNSGTSSSSNFIGTTDNANLVFKTANTERMRIGYSTGNIAIGTTSTSARLYVAADAGKTPLNVLIDGDSKLYIDTAGQIGFNTSSPDAYVVVTAPEDSNAFRVRVGGSTKLLVNRNHGVTIGANNENSPENGLYVNGNVTIGDDTTSSLYTGGAKVVVDADEYKALNIYNDYSSGSQSYGVYSKIVSSYSGNANVKAIYGFADDTYTNYGVYGVATNSSATNYGVYGYSPDYAVFGYCSGTGYAVYADGDIYCTDSYLPSDEKLKSNISSLPGALMNILKLNPVSYTYKNEEYNLMNLPKGERSGFIAQELKTVFPELVKESEHPGITTEDGRQSEAVSYNAVNYVGLVPYLVKAIQEQQEIINQQNELISKLQKENNVTKANFENQHTINMELDAKLNDLYKQVSAIQIENASK